MCEERVTMLDARILRTANAPALFYSGALSCLMLLGPVDVNVLHPTAGHGQHKTIL